MFDWLNFGGNSRRKNFKCAFTFDNRKLETEPKHDLVNIPADHPAMSFILVCWHICISPTNLVAISIPAVYKCPDNIRGESKIQTSPEKHWTVDVKLNSTLKTFKDYAYFCDKNIKNLMKCTYTVFFLSRKEKNCDC